MLALAADMLLWLNGVTGDTIHQEIELDREDKLGLWDGSSEAPGGHKATRLHVVVGPSSSKLTGQALLSASRDGERKRVSVQCQRPLFDLQEGCGSPLPIPHGVLPDGGLHGLRHVEERRAEDEFRAPAPRPGPPESTPHADPAGSQAEQGGPAAGWPRPAGWPGGLCPLPGDGQPASLAPHCLPALLRLPPGHHARHVPVQPGGGAAPPAGEAGQRRQSQSHPQPGRDAPGGGGARPARPVLLLAGGSPGRGH